MANFYKILMIILYFLVELSHRVTFCSVPSLFSFPLFSWREREKEKGKNHCRTKVDIFLIIIFELKNELQNYTLYLSINLSIYLSIYLYIYLSIYLWRTIIFYCYYFSPAEDKSLGNKITASYSIYHCKNSFGINSNYLSL